ncbi:MAG: LVIVD repeat-containing protein [Actinomycetota bacterium]
MRLVRGLLVVLVLAAASTVQAATPPARGTGNGLEPVAEVEYGDGMHLAVTRIRGHDYLFTSTAELASGGIRVFDVDDPARPELVATVPCSGGQAFLQVSHDRKTLVVGEDVSHAADICFPGGQMGFYTIDITNPRRPRPAGYGIVARGGHTITTHPKKPFLYVSYGDVVATGPPQYEVWSIVDPARPRHLTTASVTGYHGPHDIEFAPDGRHAVASSMSAIQVLDTSDPANPVELEVLQCPGCSHNHEAHLTPDGRHVIVSDEASGGAASPCPLGALYFYEWDPEGPPFMTLLGEWQPAEVVTPQAARTNVGLCTSHVFGVSRDGTRVAASWHTGGVRVVDIRKMAGVGLGAEGTGAKEVGWYVADGADSWSAKFDRSGRYVFVNDRHAGLQVYRVEAR